MIHSFTASFGTYFLTGIATSVPLSETFSLIQNNILHQYKNYKKSLRKFKFLRYVTTKSRCRVIYCFIKMLFKSTGIFHDKLRPQILSAGTTANSPLNNLSKIVSNIQE